jgi:hypothetical protein
MKTPRVHRRHIPLAKVEKSSASRGLAIFVGLTLWLALVFIYTWPAWAMVLYRLLFDGGLLLLWLAAAVGAGSLLLPLFQAFDPEADGRLLGCVTAAAMGLGMLSLTVLGLGLLGWLNRATAVGLLAAGILAGIIRTLALRRRWLIHGGLREGEAPAEPGHQAPGRGSAVASTSPSYTSESIARVGNWLARPAGWGWLFLLAAPVAAIMTAGAMLPPYLLWTPNEPHGYDVVEYHLQVPREWYEAGRIVPLHHNVYSFFPFNVEMHYLLAMHLRGGPWAGMYLAQFMHGAMIGLAVLAVGGFATSGTGTRGKSERFSRSRAAPIFGGLAMASTPWLSQLGAIAYDEGGFLLFATLAIGWAMRAVRDPERRIRRFILAGAMAGLACGVKLTAVPEVLLAIALVSLTLLILSGAREKRPPGRLISGPIAFGLAGLLTFAPWLIRTWWWSGNPVFPELPSLLGKGDFSDVQVERWHRAHTAQPSQRPILARLHAAGTDIVWSWQYGYLLLPLALAAVVLNHRDPDVWFLGALLFFLAVFWLGFTHLQSRFFILAVPICAMLISCLPLEAIGLVAAQSLLGIVLLNRNYLGLLHEKFGKAPSLYGQVIGIEDLSWMTPPEIIQVPPNAMLVLVGEGKVFLYQRPMSELRYRTPFDADTSHGRSVIEAWAGPHDKRRADYLLIAPEELERFEKTYQPFPTLPPEITDHLQPFVIPPRPGK